MIYEYEEGKLKESNKNTDIINEVMCIRDDKNNFSLHVTPDANRNLGDNIAYFKWVNNASFEHSDEIARIMLTKPQYVIHNGHDGKKTIKLNTKQKKLMIKLLEEPVSLKKKNKISNDILKDFIKYEWDYILYSYNKQLGFTDDKIAECLDIPIYSQLPINMINMKTPMPNYMQL